MTPEQRFVPLEWRYAMRHEFYEIELGHNSLYNPFAKRIWFLTIKPHLRTPPKEHS
jgi:hypothetical protein